jgi:hypothetical protein
MQLSHNNSEALDKAFSVFYKFAMSFSSVLHRSELLAATSEIREQLCMLYTDLLSLVVDVSISFYKTVHGMLLKSVAFRAFVNVIRYDCWFCQLGHLRALWRYH